MEKIDKVIEIINAYNEGKKVEYFKKNWHIAYNLDIILEYVKNNIDLLRVRKEPPYRPYDNAEEFLKASKEHGPYIVRELIYDIPLRVSDDGISLIDYTKLLYSVNQTVDTKFCNYKELIDKYKFQDGTPCGVLEE